MLGYILTIANFACIYALAILGLNILTGYAKQVSLGHAAIFALGAYSQALLVTKAGVPFFASLILASLISSIIGMLFGLPSLRVSHDHLVLTTIGLNFIVIAIVEYFDFFGGALGIVGLGTPKIFGHLLATREYLMLVVGLLILSLIFCWFFSRTWAKLLMEAIGEDELAAAVLGINVARIKLLAFAVSSALTGLAGALWAQYIGSVFPKNFGLELSITMLSMLVFGGMGTIRGALFGALFLYCLPEALRFIQNYRMLLNGVLLAAMVIWQPSGILGKGGLLDWQNIVRKRKTQ
jgi:branched-chain amino acid transport system permease protein